MLISACSEREQLNTNGEIRVRNYVALANRLSQLSKHMGSGTICTVFKMFVYACARICVGAYVHVHMCFCYLMRTFSGINGNQRLVLMWKSFISDLLVWFNMNIWTDARVTVGVGLWTMKGSRSLFVSCYASEKIYWWKSFYWIDTNERTHYMFKAWMEVLTG